MEIKDIILLNDDRKINQHELSSDNSPKDLIDIDDASI